MSAFGPFSDDGPTMVPVVPPTRFSHTPRPTHHFEHTPRPTHHFEHTPRPTAPSPSPTINYWASKEGKSIATSSACAVVLVLMVLAFMLAVDRYRRRKDAMKSTGGRDRRIGSNASSLAERWSTQFGFRSGNTEGLSATEGEESINGGGLRRGLLSGLDTDFLERLRPADEWSLLLHAPPATVVLFWALMLMHTAFVAFGLVAYWDKVNIKGTVSSMKDEDDGRRHDDATVVGNATDPSSDVLARFDEQVYIATFWINVQQFWQAEAQPVAVLIFFAGVVQPILQMLAVGAIAFYPLTPATRHAMITMQECTCKVPLSAFYVEAWLLVAFKLKIEDNKVLKLPFPFELDNTDFVANADVDITGFVGLAFFLTGQLLFLMIINLVRYQHRCQTTVVYGCDYKDDDARDASALLYVDETGLRSDGSANPDTARISSSTVLSFAPDAPPSRRERQRRWLVLGLALLLLASVGAALTSPVLSFQYTGVIGPYLSAHGEHYEDKGETLTLSLDLWDAVIRIKNSMVPEGFAMYYTVAAAIILVFNPMILALAAIHASILPDEPVSSRLHVGQVIEYLQCWCGGEAILIASIFIVPNIELITNFVFDETVQCKEVHDYAGHDCLRVRGNFEPVGFAALCTYTALAVIISRLCANELHGRGGRTDDGASDGKKQQQQEGSR